MKHVAPQLVLPLPDTGNKVVVVDDVELPDALACLRADGYHPGTMERIGNAKWRITGWPLAPHQQLNPRDTEV